MCRQTVVGWCPRRARRLGAGAVRVCLVSWMGIGNLGETVLYFDPLEGLNPQMAECQKWVTRKRISFELGGSQGNPSQAGQLSEQQSWLVLQSHLGHRCRGRCWTLADGSQIKSLATLAP